ncbi:MAG: ankyrin repeat domain-containing protein [Magnetococcales bacterium]|nr:ankyrin repeat domain-containing protein [Magnetococcales bacterium]MBF0174493.1 ankyrin repeat domain-containing protein [Magnetococcales bacterium]
MFSSLIDMSNSDLASDQTRLDEQTAAVQQANAVSRDPEIVTALLYQGRLLDAMDLQGRTTLMWAAEQGETTLVQKLLESGAEVNATDWWGRTALSLALANGHRKVVALLVEHGAHISAG